MALSTITKKVLSLSEVPKELLEGHWLSEEVGVQHLEVHLDGGDSADKVENWIMRMYPELADEVSFFIEIDIYE